MATIINNPANQGADDGMGVGMILGLLIAGILAVFVFFTYGLPYFNNTPAQNPPTQKIEVTLPDPTPTPIPTLTE